MQTTIVIIIVALAAIYLLRRIYLRLAKPAQTDCGCGCSDCATQHTCSQPEKIKKNSVNMDPS
jgi:hypothetical protein